MKSGIVSCLQKLLSTNILISCNLENQLLFHDNATVHWPVLKDHKTLALAYYPYYGMKALLSGCRFTSRRDKRSYDSGTSGHKKRNAG